MMNTNDNKALERIEETIKNLIIEQIMTNELKEVNKYKARLITYEELFDNLGYEIQTCGTDECKKYTEKTPNWVYNSNYYYWTMSPEEDSASHVWNVYYSGSLGNFDVFDYYGVVRPVINLLKSAI